MNDIEHEGMRMEMRVEGTALAVAEDRRSNLATGHVVFVDTAALLMGSTAPLVAA